MKARSTKRARAILLFVLTLSLLLLQIIPISASNSSKLGTTTSSYGAGTVGGRHTFIAASRIWAFYSDGTNGGYRSSVDGSTWSGFTSVGACGNGQLLGAFFDGTYIHYARTTGVANTPIFYRRGTPYSNGTIIWSANEQTAVTAESTISYYGSLVVIADSNGYPWVAYGRTSGTYHVAYVSKSSTNDGTWTTETNFPFALGFNEANNWEGGLVVPLTRGRVYALWVQSYTASGWDLYGRMWGSSEKWGEKEEIKLDGLAANVFSAVAEGDTIHVAYLEMTSNDIHYKKRTSDGVSSEETVRSSATSSSHPELTFSKWGGGGLICFWSGSPTLQHIYYKKRSSSGWDPSPTDWITETNLPANWYFNSFYQDYGLKVGLLYTNSSASPYDVRFNYLTVTQTLGLNAFQFIGSTSTPWTDEPLTLRATWYTPGATVTFQNYSGGSWVSLGTDTVDSDGYAEITVTHRYNTTTTYRAYINASYYSGNLTLTWHYFHIFRTGITKVNYMNLDEMDSIAAPNIGHNPNPKIVWVTLQQGTLAGLGKLNRTSGFWKNWIISGSYNRGIDLASNSTHVFFGDVPGTAGQLGHFYVFNKATEAVTTYNLGDQYAASNFAYNPSTKELWFLEALYTSTPNVKVRRLCVNGTLKSYPISTLAGRPAGTGGFIFGGSYWWLYHGDEGYVARFFLNNYSYTEYFVADTDYSVTVKHLDHWAFDGSQYAYIFFLGTNTIYKWDISSTSIVARYNCSKVGVGAGVPRGGALYVNGSTTFMLVTGDTYPRKFFVWNMSVSYSNSSQPWMNITRLSSTTWGGQTMPRWTSTAFGDSSFTNIVNVDTWLPDVEAWAPSDRFGLLNSLPTIGQFEAPSTIKYGDIVLLNCTIVDANGVNDFDWAVLGFEGNLSGNILLKWVNETNVFSELYDPNNFVTLNASASFKTQLNTTAYKLTWSVKFSSSKYPTGYKAVIEAQTKVWDASGNFGSGGKENWFYFEGNSPPAIGSFTYSKGIITDGDWFILNSLVNDPNGVDDFKNVTVELPGQIILLWNASTDTFSEVKDPYKLCTLLSDSSKTLINSTSYQLHFKLVLTSVFGQGYKWVWGDVYDKSGAHDSITAVDSFYFYVKEEELTGSSGQTTPSGKETTWVYCTNCGQQVPEGTEICPACGQKIEGFSGKPTYCPACGSELVPFCPECGAELPEGAEFCPACGAKIETPDVCPVCGEKIASPAPTIPTIFGNVTSDSLAGQLAQNFASFSSDFSRTFMPGGAFIAPSPEVLRPFIVRHGPEIIIWLILLMVLIGLVREEKKKKVKPIDLDELLAIKIDFSTVSGEGKKSNRVKWTLLLIVIVTLLLFTPLGEYVKNMVIMKGG